MDSPRYRVLTGWSFADPDEGVHELAIGCVIELVDFAGNLGANVNIGRVRGQYREGADRRQTEWWAVEALRKICGRAQTHSVEIALETVMIMQTNFINTLS